MRRAVARGRMFPQNFSTDRRYGRLSLKAISIFPLMWANADDQGRLIGDPEEIKYAVCPNIDHITKADIPGILRELVDNKLILLYDSPKSPAVQFIDWWDANVKMQWAWPSEYPPPKNWKDHLRYKKDAHTVYIENWPVSGEGSGEPSGEDADVSHLNTTSLSGEPSGEDRGPAPLTTPLLINKKRRGRGRGNSPERSGEKPAPAPYRLSVGENRVYEVLKENYSKRWGKVLSVKPMKIEPRKLGAKEGAQLRDLAIELSRAGGGGAPCQDDVIQKAFDECVTSNKFYITYLRAVLFDWLGIKREQHGA